MREITVEHRGRTVHDTLSGQRAVNGEVVDMSETELDDREADVRAAIKESIDQELDAAQKTKDEAKAIVDDPGDDPKLIAVQAMFLEVLEANNADRRARGEAERTLEDAKRAAKARIDSM